MTGLKKADISDAEHILEFYQNVINSIKAASSDQNGMKDILIQNTSKQILKKKNCIPAQKTVK